MFYSGNIYIQLMNYQPIINADILTAIFTLNRDCFKNKRHFNYFNNLLSFPYSFVQFF